VTVWARIEEGVEAITIMGRRSAGRRGATERNRMAL
jgi:hypothetical protein